MADSIGKKLITEWLGTELGEGGLDYLTGQKVPKDLAGFDLLEKAGGVAEKFMAGEIPEDVSKRVQELAAMKSLKSGLGLGQAGFNLTARDLGLTTIDVMERGAQLGTQISQAKLQFEALSEQAVQDERQWLTNLRSSEIAADTLRLEGMNIASQNQRFAWGAVIDIIKANSQQAIPEAQDIKDMLLGTDETPGFFGETNEYIKALIEKYGTVLP